MTRKTRGTRNAEPTEIFDGIWWRVRLPSGWSGHPDKECATFRARPPRGALQISSARKDEGRVTDQDLKEFAEGRVPLSTALRALTIGLFSGFSAEYSREGCFWKEWWLRSGHLMVYVTYNVEGGSEDSETAAVERIMASLEPVQ
jgi:hypothetical protein